MGERTNLYTPDGQLFGYAVNLQSTRDGFTADTVVMGSLKIKEKAEDKG